MASRPLTRKERGLFLRQERMKAKAALAAKADAEHGQAMRDAEAAELGRVRKAAEAAAAADAADDAAP